MSSIPDALARMRREALEDADPDRVPTHVHSQSERKQRLLSSLTQRFLQLFMTSSDNVVSLENAAHLLCSAPPPACPAQLRLCGCGVAIPYCLSKGLELS